MSGTRLWIDRNSHVRIGNTSAELIDMNKKERHDVLRRYYRKVHGGSSRFKTETCEKLYNKLRRMNYDDTLSSRYDLLEWMSNTLPGLMKRIKDQSNPQPEVESDCDYSERSSPKKSPAKKRKTYDEDEHFEQNKKVKTEDVPVIGTPQFNPVNMYEFPFPQFDFKGNIMPYPFYNTPPVFQPTYLSEKQRALEANIREITNIQKLIDDQKLKLKAIEDKLEENESKVNRELKFPN